MVKVWILSALLLMTTWVQAQELKLAQTQMMLGQSTSVQFFVMGDMYAEPSPVEQLIAQWDWSSWQQHFVIEQESIGQRSLRLRLYPIRAGVFELPAQSVAGVTMAATTFMVVENPEVSVEWQAAPQNAYWGQSWPWSVSTKVAHSAYVVEPKVLQQPEWLFPKWQQAIGQSHEFVLLSEQVQGRAVEQQWQSFYQLQLPLDVNPISRVTMNLNAPMIEVRGSGAPWRFVTPVQSVQMQALPSFLPAHVLIGDVSLQSQPVPTFLEQGELYYWTLQLRGAQMTEEALLLAVRHWLSEQTRSEAFEWFAPTLSANNAEVTITLPLRPKQAGHLHLPAWQLAYFDPETGKVVRQPQPEYSLLSVPWLLWMLAYALLSVIGFTVVALSTLFLQEWGRRYRQVAQVKRAKDVVELWRGLQASFQVQTVGEFAQVLNEAESAWVVALQTSLYAAEAKEDLLALQDAIQAAIWAQPWGLVDRVKDGVKHASERIGSIRRT